MKLQERINLLSSNSNRRLKQFIKRPDFRQNPIKAVLKRFLWRWHWTISSTPFSISFAKDLIINLPKTGSASLIYYQGFSELETAKFVSQFLKPGMVFVDVGAHIGEYTMLAAKVVGKSGQVHSFEPQSTLFPILTKNIQINGFDRVRLNQSAVSDRLGEIEFQVFDEPSVSSIRKNVATDEQNHLISVPTISLDAYLSKYDNRVDLIKVDVEGAEKLVFQGASNLLNLPKHEAPTWIFEYSPNSYSAFGYGTEELFKLLDKFGYEIFVYSRQGKIEKFGLNTPTSGIINLIATKNRETLISQIN